MVGGFQLFPQQPTCKLFKDSGRVCNVFCEFFKRVAVAEDNLSSLAYSPTLPSLSLSIAGALSCRTIYQIRYFLWNRGTGTATRASSAQRGAVWTQTFPVPGRKMIQ